MATSKKPKVRPSKPSIPQESTPTPTSTPAPVEPEYTLPVLVARTGPATKPEALAHLGAYDTDDLVALGRRSDTARVSRDAQRLYGISLDFLVRATPDQRVLLGAVTPDRLRVGVWAAAEGDRLDTALTTGATSAGQKQASTRSKWQSLRAQAVKRRDLLHAVATTWLGDAPAVADAFGTTRTAAQIAASLRALTKLVRSCLASRTPEMVARTRGTALTAEWLDTVEALADDVEKVGTAAESARAAAPVSQGEVDLWDGLNITLLARLIDAFDAAHAEDAAIPRLIPLSLRSLLGSSHRPAPAAPPVPTPTP